VKVKSYSQDTEKASGYRVEVPQHIETTRWYYS